jgi:excisionase family DNA binding protein
MLEKLLSVEQAAPLLGWKPRTIYNKISKKELPLPFIKLHGGDVRFRPNDIELYLQSRIVKPVR